MNPLRNILRSVTMEADTQLNLLVAPFNGFFEQMLQDAGHKVTLLPNIKYPCDTSLIGDMKILNDPNYVGVAETFDAVICNDRVVQYEMCMNIASAYHIPLIVVEHYNPTGMLHPDDLATLKEMQKYNAYVATSQNILNDWEIEGEPIPYGISDKLPIDKSELILAIGNFQPLELNHLRHLGGTNKMFIVNLNTPNQLDRKTLSDLYSKADIFVSLTPHNFCSIPMLEAMSHGCAVISNNLSVLNGTLDASNAMLCDDSQQFKHAINALRSNVKMREMLGRNARTTIHNRYNLELFASRWDSLLRTTINKGYIR